MASHIPMSKKALDMNTALTGTGIVDAASSTPAAKTPKTNTKVGATGDNAASPTGLNLSALSKATSKVGDTGDNAAKKGTGA